MSDGVREVEIGEGGFTVLLLGLVAGLALSFWLGVRLGLRQGQPGPEPVAAAAASASLPARRGPVEGGRSTPAAVLTGAGNAGAASSPSVTPAAAALALPVFLGPPPLASPAPLGGVPGISLRGERKAVALEVLAVADMDRALAERLRLLGRGYPAYVATLPDPAGSPRFRVRVGDYATAAEAEAVRTRLRERERVTATVVN